jgi:hypothetical protein
MLGDNDKNYKITSNSRKQFLEEQYYAKLNELNEIK